MPNAKSATQRSREYRARQKLQSDPEKAKAAKEKERLRWHKRKEEGKVKTIDDLSARGKRQRRKSWRMAKVRQVELRKQGNDAVQSVLALTESRQKKEGSKRVRRDRTKLQRKVVTLEAKLQTKHQQLAKYRKILERSQQKDYNMICTGQTPRSAARRIMLQSKSAVHRQLVFHFATLEELNERKKSLKLRKDKITFNSVFKGKVFKKYRLCNVARRSFGLQPKRKTVQGEISGSTRAAYTSKTAKIACMIKEFFCRDDNSRITTVKTQTITRCKVKQPKRFLTADLQDLHKKYLHENPQVSLSYTSFCRQKPFYVVRPKESDRESCLCKRHENMLHMAEKLHYHKVLPTANTEKLLADIVCSTSRQDCMYRTCKDCKSKQLVPLTGEPSQTTWWYEWKSIKETYEVTNATSGQKETKIAQKTVKQKSTGTVSELIGKINAESGAFTTHVFNMQHQFKEYRKLKASLNERSVLIHVDFSENYNCKYADEIQSMHFGASHKQASLHTGVTYTSTGLKSFCTISPSKRHDPNAIWAHLDPILSAFNPEIDTVHFWSDGPTTQYRNKRNFQLLSSRIYQYGIVNATWNFSEASHGKGAPDGIGGAVKRQADKFIHQKHDIPDAYTMYTMLNNKGDIQYHYISEEDIAQLDESDANHPTVKGTMKIHQLTVAKKHVLAHRILSCFCSYNCNCYNPTFVTFHQAANDSEPEIPSSSGDRVHSNPSGSSSEAQTAQTGHDIATAISCSESTVGNFFIVAYDGGNYLGGVKAVDVVRSEFEVNCLSKIGSNRFVWNHTDIAWYKRDAMIYPVDVHNISGRVVSICSNPLYQKYFK